MVTRLSARVTSAHEILAFSFLSIFSLLQSMSLLVLLHSAVIAKWILALPTSLLSFPLCPP